MGLLKRNISPYDGILFRSAVQSKTDAQIRLRRCGEQNGGRCKQGVAAEFESLHRKPLG
jgi:hypothetical protein